jgi:hypothetical protein
MSTPLPTYRLVQEIRTIPESFDFGSSDAKSNQRASRRGSESAQALARGTIARMQANHELLEAELPGLRPGTGVNAEQMRG